MAVLIEANAEPIPGYRLIDRLGGGGFGEVWRAIAPGGMHKAIKFVFGDLSGAADKGQRAEQELKALKRVITVRHPYILSLERYDIIDGRLMIVMELADRNLWDRFKECRSKGLPGIPREELLGYMEESSEALDLMNREYQLQHLDIKPQNLFLIRNHVKVADFGLVKDLENSQAAVTGGITPVYAAPETFDGKVTRYSDQYSLAIVYQELLTGKRPFSGNNVRQLIMQHLTGIPDVEVLPEGDRAAILRGLSKEPPDRFPTCREMVEALRAADSPQGHVVVARPSSPGAITVPGAGQVVVPSSWQGMVTPPPSSPPTSDLRVRPASGSGQGATQSLRALESVLQAPQGMQAPRELAGPGCLFPALVIGLGNTGMMVLRRLREAMQSFVAPLTQVPSLRFLLIDTDPDIVRGATRGTGGAGLSASEVLLAPLNRPSYYLKPREGRPPLETWINPKLLYRIPRSQVTTGVRSLGRLAYLDNYRSIARRLMTELETVLEPQALAAAARNTKLGFRSNRPRVYVVTNLGGGTGGGLFIDLAYTLRALLRQAGYDSPDVTGVLLAPPVDGNRSRMMTLGNTYAALMELNHYGSPGAVFRAKYHDREGELCEAAPPFTRNVVLPMPDETDEVAARETIDLVSQFLYRDIATPLGKAADLGRAGLPAPEWQARGLHFSSFNLYQLTWPRQAMVQAIARELCKRTVARWMSKDSKPVRGAVQGWVEDECDRDELTGEGFLARLQTAMVKKMGRPVQTLIARAIEPLTKGSAQGEPPGKSRGRNEPKGLPPEQVGEVLAELEALLGKPHDDGPPEDDIPVVAALRAAAGALRDEWGQRMAELSVHLIEEPAYRLAGAEEASRQLVARLERELQSNEPMASELSKKALESWECLRAYAAPEPGRRRPNLSAPETLELVRAYGKWRYQSMLLNHLSGSLVGLRGHLSDQLREVNFCRVRLADLLRSLEAPPESETSLESLSGDDGLSRRLFQAGCHDLRGAVETALAEVTAEKMLELDTAFEAMLKAKFTALVHVCLTTANVLRDVELSMLAVAREFAAQALPRVSAAQLFLEQHPDPDEADGELARCFDEAAPELTPGRSPRGGPAAELVVVAAPDDDASREVRKLLQEGRPRVEVLEAGGEDDLVIYRERLNMALTDLESFGPIGHDAYMQMSGAENFTPHSRADVDFRGK